MATCRAPRPSRREGLRRRLRPAGADRRSRTDFALSPTVATSVVAVCLAGVGAVFFGLAAVRQHGAVTASAPSSSATFAEQVTAGLRLLRQPAWWVGAVQAGLGGGLHVVALALAPITLVQPIGVLAVPVTVVASALTRRQRPAATQVVGALLSVAGVAALTVVLLRPATVGATLPPWATLATGSAVVVAASAALALVVARAPAALRCVGRAVTAAALFGLNSVLIRALGLVVMASPPHLTGTVVTCLVGLAVALPVGVLLMQSAYLSGSPQVVICCLTLVDPVTAVTGGRVLLHDGAAVAGATLLAALACAVLAVAGVVLLAKGYPVQKQPASSPTVAA